MGALRLGFNPHLAPQSRRRLHERLREVVDIAVRLEFEIVELNLSTSLYELGLSTVFDGGAIEILDDAPVRFHLNLFADAAHGEWPSVTDLSATSRGIALRQFVQIVEFFEQRQPMGMYVVHPGRRAALESAHMDALRESFRTMHNLFPGLPISVENARKGAVLSDLDSVLVMLEATGNVRFSLHTGRAFHSVDANHLAFEARIDYLRQFRGPAGGDPLAQHGAGTRSKPAVARPARTRARRAQADAHHWPKPGHDPHDRDRGSQPAGFVQRGAGAAPSAGRIENRGQARPARGRALFELKEAHRQREEHGQKGRHDS